MSVRLVKGIGMSVERVVANREMGSGAFRWFDFVMAAFVTILLLSNVIGAGKVAVITLPVVGEWPFGAGILFFPLSYVIGDVLTEVYGYARAAGDLGGDGGGAVHGVHELCGGGTSSGTKLDQPGGL